MPGPCSAPNGDRDLVDAVMVCAKHGQDDQKCDDKCSSYTTLRLWLTERGKLRTGKTRSHR